MYMYIYRYFWDVWQNSRYLERVKWLKIWVQITFVLI